MTKKPIERCLHPVCSDLHARYLRENWDDLMTFEDFCERANQITPEEMTTRIVDSDEADSELLRDIISSQNKQITH
jgi:hypothetical protein